VQLIAFFAFEAAAVHAVISLEVPDDPLDGLASFEQPAFFIGVTLVIAPVFDLDARVVLVHTPKAHLGVHKLWLGHQTLHQDDALLDLLVYVVPVIVVTLEALGSHDRISLQRHIKACLHSKFVGIRLFHLEMHATSGKCQLKVWRDYRSLCDSPSA
jgi:hypothetical protein